MKKAIIIVPLMEDEFKKREFGNREFLGPQYLVAQLRKNGVECDFINAHAYRLSNQDVCDRVKKENYDFIGISCASQRGYPFTSSLIKLLRLQGCCSHICLGGFFTSIAFHDILNDLKELDTMLLGESEYTICELVQAVLQGKDYRKIKGIAYLLNNEVVWSKPERITDLDCIPFPIRDINAFEDISILGTNKVINKFFRVVAGRGCYGNCAFCTLINFYQPRHKIYRSVENLISELELLVDTYDIHDFRFNDEIFYELSDYGKKWVHRFVKGIKEKQLQIRFNIELRPNDVREQEIQALKSIGLERVAIGAESGVQRILDEMNKNCTVEQIRSAINILRKNDIDTAVGFITIIPTMSFAELKMNYEFLFDTQLDSEENLYNKLNLYCGCEYVNIMKNKQLFIESEHFFERHNYLYSDSRVALFAEVIENIRRIFSGIKEDIFNTRNDDQELYLKMNNKYIYYSHKIWKNIVIFLLESLELHGMDESPKSLEKKALQHIQCDLDTLRHEILSCKA